ncbi:L,D-transpeptidase [Solirubrobacter soli]|uniref:L,D-transpeptidase n=1 Tax=Solirubrobacter soli TaxID=363832 RepID=UPI00146D9811|nr:Ig-like domain-containing protein [Solirubrobacter soli]
MRASTLPVVLALGAVLAGCSSGRAQTAAPAGKPSHRAAAAEASASPTPRPSLVRVSISPSRGGVDVRPDRGIIVRATGGTLAKVTVRSGGDAVAGTLNAAKTVWRSRWALGVSRSYRVTATATGPDGRHVTRRRAFRTLTPKRTFAPRTILVNDGTYGVGMPLIFYFDEPVTNRKAVERSLEIRTSRRVVGSWFWDDSCGIVPLCLYFRPRRYWRPHTRVRFTAHVNGVQAAPGVFGARDLSGTIRIGRSLKVFASTAKHSMTVYRDGKRYARWPISTGRPGDDTPNGTYLSIEKGNPVRMIGEDYDMQVPYAVRITWSGVYLHAASWSVGSQGSTNVSHGCINMSPEAAASYYAMSIPGDPVTVTGSSRAGTFDNGWTMWFKSWKQWRRGSALHRVVRAGPDGSSFESYST